VNYATISIDRSFHAERPIPEDMSWWALPTTADVGIRAFSLNASGAMSEAALGLQSLQQTSPIDQSLLQSANISYWEVEAPGGDLARGLVKWLEEVLFKGQEEGQWLVESSVEIVGDTISAQVSWVESDSVELGLEVKAITLHELVMREIGENELVRGIEPEIPSFQGPGWMAQVILDI